SQVQYTSTNLAGDNYIGLLTWEVVKRFAVAGGGSDQTFSIPNDTDTPQNVTVMTFSSLYCYYEIRYTIFRRTDSGGIRESGRIFASYNGFDEEWTLTRKQDEGG